MDVIEIDAFAWQPVDLIVGGTDPRVTKEHFRNLLHVPFTDIDFRHELSTVLTCGSVIGPVSVGRPLTNKILLATNVPDYREQLSTFMERHGPFVAHPQRILVEARKA
ncbi:hypothetical protein Acor_36340 [Acrocarpospora corrugata]|uniref:Uncharacterized protein n=1 Tax=Acrocarpospora corrugata TaxID=35763 RepID=A0A5M3W031_9ACTN|nr:hypothetical protein [Acrocarpospora corrugata]GES01570.1 hypothetical protein Acor_36340 [Acrocarpospora corrugata]